MQYYASPHPSLNLRTKSYARTIRTTQSVTQCLEDYWLGLRLEDMDILAIHLIRENGVAHDTSVMHDTAEDHLNFFSCLASK